MAVQTVKHGAPIETATPAEVASIVKGAVTSDRVARIRAPQGVLLDGAGAGQVEVYKVPSGMEFVARRVVLNLDTASDPSTGNVPLNVAAKFVQYLRSGVPIEYAVPQSPNAIPQVPGVQTWGDEQGPYLRNAEVFEIRAVGLTPGARLLVSVEGILYRRDERD